MASIETNPTQSFSFGGFFSRIGTSLVSAFNVATEANGRVAQIEALQRLTDEELAAKDLRREDIARYVFRDLFYV